MSFFGYNVKYEPSYPIGKYYGQKYEGTDIPFELKYSSPTFKYPTKPSLTFSEGSKKFFYKIDISKGSDWYFLTGHSVNGKKVYPASGYLYLVWTAFANYHNTKFYELPVAFDDVEFNYPTVFDAPQAEMYVRFYEPQYNYFEVYYNDKVVVNGRIYLPTETETIGWKEYTQNMWRTKPYTDVLEEEEIYKEFETKGYEYQDLFKGIYKLTTDGTKGELYWYGKWLSFLETIMQMNYWNKPGYYYPTYIKSIRINPRVHDKWIQKFDESNYSYLKNKKPTFDMKYYGKYEYPEYTGLVPFYYDPYTNLYTAGGVEIYGFYSKPYPKIYFEKFITPSETTGYNITVLKPFENLSLNEWKYTTTPLEWKNEWKYTTTPLEWKNEWKYPTTPYEWKYPTTPYPYIETPTPYGYSKEIKPEYASTTYPRSYTFELKNPSKSYYSTTTQYYKPSSYPTDYLIPKNTFEKLNDIDITPKMHPVFVIHPIEGHVNMLKDWAKSMKYPVYGIQYTSEAIKYDTIEKLARFYIEKIEKRFDPHTPFHLIGYSFGGSVAYEMATIKKNHILSLTFLDGSVWYPSAFLKTKEINKNLPRMEAEYLFSFLHALNLTHKFDYKQFVGELLSLPSFESRLEWTIKYFLKYTTSSNYGHFEIEQACRAYVIRMFMSLNYQPKTKLHFQTLLIKPKFNEYVELWGEDYDLNKWFDGKITIEIVPGDQNGFLEPINTQRIATYLNNYLAKWYY